MEDDRAAYLGATAFIDRLSVERTGSTGAQSPAVANALRTYASLGKLRLLEYETEVFPGVKIAVSPGDIRTGSVRLIAAVERLRSGPAPSALKVAKKAAIRRPVHKIDRRSSKMRLQEII